MNMKLKVWVQEEVKKWKNGLKIGQLRHSKWWESGTSSMLDGSISPASCIIKTCLHLNCSWLKMNSNLNSDGKSHAASSWRTSPTNFTGVETSTCKPLLILTRTWFTKCLRALGHLSQHNKNPRQQINWFRSLTTTRTKNWQKLTKRRIKIIILLVTNVIKFKSNKVTRNS